MPSKAAPLFCVAAIACLNSFVARAAPAPDSVSLPETARVDAIEKWLPELPGGLGPRITDRAAWQQLAQGPAFQKLIASADKINAQPVVEVI